MTHIHGTLENEILDAVWTIEEGCIDENREKNISVSDVLLKMNSKGSIRAYTTIKTVMDRLVEKNLLKRQKIGKKFFYKSIQSREKMAETAINKVVSQYFNNDMRSLMRVLEKQCLSLKV